MFRRRRKASDFSAEIEAHVELDAERLMERGLSREEARTAALRRFGNVNRARERFYEGHRWAWWDNLVRDGRFALRMLRKSPVFTTTIVLTIALGVGATTAIFSVVNATLLHPLPFPEPEQLVSVHDDLPGIGARDAGLSQPEWQDLQHSGVFQYVSPAWFDENNMTGGSAPERVSLLIVAPNYFALLGVKPQLGATFNPQNYTPGFTGEAVISDSLWKQRFGADPKILGRNIRMDTDLYRIIGVMPPGFRSPERTPSERHAEIWAATSFYGAPLKDQPPRNVRNLPEAIARLAPGVTLETAQSRMNALVASLEKEYPADYPQQSAWRIRLVLLKRTLVGDVRRSLVLLFAAVGLVALIGCLNVANLLLSRASARGREMALRQALGASRSRLISQLLTESLLLALLGGIAGTAILFGMQRFLLGLVPDSLPRLSEISISWTVLLFALGASLISGAIFGLAPALQSSRLAFMEGLKDAVRGSSGPGAQARTRRALVVMELALSLVLTVSACLLLRSFWALLNAPLGFNATRVTTVRTRLPYPNVLSTDRYATAAQEAPFIRELLRRSKTLPGVEDVAIGDSGAIPLDSSQRELNRLAGRFFFEIEGRDISNGQSLVVDRLMVTPNYFHLLGIPLVRGRLFDDFDDASKSQVAVVDEGFAQTYWPNEDAIGKRFRSTRAGSQWTIVVGVVANARTGSVAQEDPPQVYVSLYQTGSHHLAIFLRGQLDQSAIARQVREQVQSVDSRLPVFGAQQLKETISASLEDRKFAMEMIGMFALVALLLAGIGIYGVISYMVSARTLEFGIRMALGAQKRDILMMVLRQGLALATVATAVGLVASVLVSEMMKGMLYGLTPTDPLTLISIAALVICIALASCYVPASRAVRVNPQVALKCD